MNGIGLYLLVGLFFAIGERIAHPGHFTGMTVKNHAKNVLGWVVGWPVFLAARILK